MDPTTRVTTCREASCGRQIVFLKTAAGKTIPIDAETFETGDEQFDGNRHVTHFRTCPAANSFRTRERSYLDAKGRAGVPE
jgi:hypothetical protein